MYHLLKKYSQGTCTATELAALEAWYAALGRQLPDQVIDPESDAAQLLTRQKLQELKSRMGQPAAMQVVKTPLWKKVLRYAAIWIGVVATIGAGYYLLHDNRQTNGYAMEASRFNRYITLPDGSTVILHAGSQLQFPEAFTGTNREVTLSGEAYFDIRRDSLKPFIINTGRLKTTVLGTAFNIQAYPGVHEITVSVTRGKVKVEDDRKVLAVLTPDQQIIYNTTNATAAQQTVNASAKINWTTTDMTFENATFETIAANLNRRYQVNIQFSNEALKQCPIRVSFTGTESLKEVLDVICQVRNATYTIDNGHDVLIRGKGCNQ
ncbi:FecR family protein [Chitinophaga arvensicola]|uniref:FecR family protein n=1 Tax=Chitinophaga arvensicola TaxID=29529 RepID=UPI0015A61BF1|nr:FecR family protein [Chitinophaga arvensicola]